MIIWAFPVAFFSCVLDVLASQAAFS